MHNFDTVFNNHLLRFLGSPVHVHNSKYAFLCLLCLSWMITVQHQPVETGLTQERNIGGHDDDADIDIVNIVGVSCGSRHSFV